MSHEPPFTNPAPSVDDYLDLLAALVDEARAGRIRAISFMLDMPPQPGDLVITGPKALIDSYGSPSHVEQMNREQCKRIHAHADAVNPPEAARLRADMPPLRVVN